MTTRRQVTVKNKGSPEANLIEAYRRICSRSGLGDVDLTDATVRDKHLSACNVTDLPEWGVRIHYMARSRETPGPSSDVVCYRW